MIKNREEQETEMMKENQGTEREKQNTEMTEDERKLQ